MIPLIVGIAPSSGVQRLRRPAHRAKDSLEVHVTGRKERLFEYPNGLSTTNGRDGRYNVRPCKRGEVMNRSFYPLSAEEDAVPGPTPFWFRARKPHLRCVRGVAEPRPDMIYRSSCTRPALLKYWKKPKRKARSGRWRAARWWPKQAARSPLCRRIDHGSPPGGLFGKQERDSGTYGRREIMRESILVSGQDSSGLAPSSAHTRASSKITPRRVSPTSRASSKKKPAAPHHAESSTSLAKGGGQLPHHTRVSVWS